jgi:hypothetical protein
MLVCKYWYSINYDNIPYYSTLPWQKIESHVTAHNTSFLRDIVLREPRTKQFYSECQSSSDLPSSQAARSIGAPISTGPRLANRQSIRGMHPGSQAFSGLNRNSLYTKSKGRTSSAKPTSASRLREHSRNGCPHDPADHRKQRASQRQPTPRAMARLSRQELRGPAIFIDTTRLEHGDLPRGNVAAHPLR